MTTGDDLSENTPETDPKDAARAKRISAFRARSTVELALETWESFPKLGLERVRVLGGWLYRPLTEKTPSGIPALVLPLTFVPDPPKLVYTASAPPSSSYGVR